MFLTEHADHLRGKENDWNYMDRIVEGSDADVLQVDQQSVAFWTCARMASDDVCSVRGYSQSVEHRRDLRAPFHSDDVFQCLQLLRFRSYTHKDGDETFWP